MGEHGEQLAPGGADGALGVARRVVGGHRGRDHAAGEAGEKVNDLGDGEASGSRVGVRSTHGVGVEHVEVKVDLPALPPDLRDPLGAEPHPRVLHPLALARVEVPPTHMDHAPGVHRREALR